MRKTAAKEVVVSLVVFCILSIISIISIIIITITITSKLSLLSLSSEYHTSEDPEPWTPSPTLVGQWRGVLDGAVEKQSRVTRIVIMIELIILVMIVILILTPNKFKNTHQHQLRRTCSENMSRCFVNNSGIESKRCKNTNRNESCASQHAGRTKRNNTASFLYCHFRPSDLRT